ncbi:MAG: histidine kinase [Betaproteobacteria bacterium]|nr:histidine kinase [Betaproteobacteria bacterium]
MDDPETSMNEVSFPVVGIGASAGGVEAFHTFFANMPADSGMAFVVILHLPVERTSMLREIIARWTSMRVLDAPNGTRIAANCVYVPPAHTSVTLEDGCLRVRPPQRNEEKTFRPIDTFFDALGKERREHSVGIVLSGTGADGALGIKAIKECGGLTLAQLTANAAAVNDQMPARAIATGAVDLVATIEDIAGHLLRMKGGRLATLPTPADSARQIDEARLTICAILRHQLGHDFSGYRDKTFMRRVRRRMQVVNISTLGEYVIRLRADSAEVIGLFRDLLIRVTSFFRDKATFEVLQSEVIPRLFAGKRADSTVRLWVPGCATGEEAYSLAMLLHEHMDNVVGPPRVQIFATDIDDAAITTARLGIYPSTLVEGLGPARLERFFNKTQDGYAVARDIRQCCTFSAHNLLRDPPFSRMDLVSCRNLLIYLDAALQEAVIPVFHYALEPGGILLLGSAESASKHAELFAPIDKRSRIFQRREGRSPPLNLLTDALDLTSPGFATSRSGSRAAHPPSAYARSPEYRSAVFGTSERRSKPELPPEAVPVIEPPARLSGIGVLWRRIFPGTPEIHHLRFQLLSSHEELQALAEEHQTALEELRSSNEELQSVNEEMQSTNEELETSKDALQSVNEELQTVNARLSDKVKELDATNSDLRNLFDSTEIATIFLDRNLLVRSFTPAIAALYNLIPSDLGRPLTDIVTKLRYDGVREDVVRVLDTMQPLERRIAREDKSTHYVMRILPYREPDSTVSGVLITFLDVTSIVQAETTLREADLRKDVFLATLSHELRNPLAPIRTAARLLESAELSNAQLAQCRAVISRQVVHMSSLLDDLLDLSRITRGFLALKKTYVDIERLIEDAVEAVQPAIDTRGHILRMERPAEPVIMEIDAIRLTQVVTNLLTNAVRYTPEKGRIVLGWRIESDAVIIFVRDNGAGIAREMSKQIFSMFARVESESSRADGGLGIGLALVKGLVELHGGRIEAHSEGLGKGSEFVVSLPRALVIDEPLATPAALHVDSGPQVAKRVLIADDNVDGADTLGMFLKLEGHEIHIAHTGQEAFALAARVRPDIAILDIGMPDITGYDLARRIRLEAWGSNMLLIALTGWGQENDKRLSLVAGFDHHLTKPVDPRELIQLFAGN